MDLLKTKPLDMLRAEADEAGEHSLKRALGPVNLITLGIGAIIGAGIFVLTGAAAAQYAGPAIVLSFILAGIGCVFAGLCYSEFASLIPIAGSAYTYGYATLGEIFAWIIGWDLILEYAFGAATVASGWSGYVVSFLQDFGIHLPPQLTATPGTDLVMYHNRWERLATILPTAETRRRSRQPAARDRGFQHRRFPRHRCDHRHPGDRHQGIGRLQLRDRDREGGDRAGVHRHRRALRAGQPSLATANWHPFIPPNAGDFGKYGWSGVARAAGVIFFAYIGFDAVSTAAQEAKNPQKDMPIGILGSLVICTILYILVRDCSPGWFRTPRSTCPTRWRLASMLPAFAGAAFW